MPKAYLIRCVLDTEEDVVRDILILENSRLSLMHKAIINAFGIAPGEMSSFFRSNDNWEQGEEIFTWLERGAYFYVCGDAKRMAKEVEQVLLEIIQLHGQREESEAKEYLKNLRQKKRYLKDVY